MARRTDVPAGTLGATGQVVSRLAFACTVLLGGAVPRTGGCVAVDARGPRIPRRARFAVVAGEANVAGAGAVGEGRAVR